MHSRRAPQFVGGRESRTFQTMGAPGDARAQVLAGRTLLKRLNAQVDCGGQKSDPAHNGQAE